MFGFIDVARFCIAPPELDSSLNLDGFLYLQDEPAEQSIAVPDHAGLLPVLFHHASFLVIQNGRLHSPFSMQMGANSLRFSRGYTLIESAPGILARRQGIGGRWVLAGQEQSHWPRTHPRQTVFFQREARPIRFDPEREVPCEQPPDNFPLDQDGTTENPDLHDICRRPDLAGKAVA